ncbi:MAG TPA: hypothetical protein VJT74_09455, partial [Pyrinomonadaceae bacterium]|nr:hypothetical protein [Pyrinomonadaceae bacterium]
ATPQLMTLKYPSDRDEIVYRPYYIKSATTAKAGATARTLKYPSDRDEIDYYAVYVDAKDVPRTQKAGAKLKEANVKLTSKPPEGDEG